MIDNDNDFKINFSDAYNRLSKCVSKFTPHEEVVVNKLAFLANTNYNKVSTTKFVFNFYYVSIIVSFILTIILCIKPPFFLCKEIKNKEGVLVKKLSFARVFICFIVLSCVSCLFFWLKSKNFFRG